MNEQVVAVYRKNGAKYPEKDFRPSESYPEYLFKEEMSETPNDVYAMIRSCFEMQKMDEEHIGKADWNPLKEVVHPGDYVVLKPNLVMDHNPSGDGIDCLITHPSLVAAVLDYVLIALAGHGTVVVGDAPMQECNLGRLVSQSGYQELINYFQSKIKEKEWEIDFKFVDFRGFTSVSKHGISIGKEVEGHGKVIDLKDESEFAVYNEDHLKKLRITNYNPEILAMHHTVGKHEYYVSDEILKADVVINMPKPKTHRKAGVTISLKNLIGINVRKEYLPHHCIGEKSDGGDEYSKKSILKHWKSQIQDRINYNQAVGKTLQAEGLVLIRKVITAFIRLTNDSTWEGSWYGNETISKTIADLNKILKYCDKDGNLCETAQRKLYIIADMIVSGEKDGPVRPSAKEVGIVAMGAHPVCFDEAIATIMGMDIRKLPTLRQVRRLAGRKSLIQDNEVAYISSNESCWNKKHIKDIKREDTLAFEPTEGWKGHIEL